MFCHRCGADFERTGNYQKWCLGCRIVEAKQRFREFEQRQRHPCPGCSKPIARSSLRCRACGQKARIKKLSGENNYAWKGGRSRDGHGYIHLLVAPEKRKGHRYQPEHRVVWEAAHGSLPKGWVVHHLNGIKDDNRLENLQAVPRKQHGEIHEQTIQQLLARIADLEAQLSVELAQWKS